MLRKLFMLLAFVALVGIVALTVVKLIPTFTELDFGDPESHFENQSDKYILTVKVEGEGTVTGVNESYSEGEPAMLEALAADGWVFNGWYKQSGEPISIEQRCSIVVEKDTTIVAKFVKIAE